MRKALAIAAFFIPLLAGCSAASPVTLTWDNPRFNATALGSCTPSATDTLKDLARIEIWAQQSGRTDSTLVLQRVEAGKEAKADSAVVQQQEGTFLYWIYLFDFLDNRSCRSNTATKTILLPPAPGTMR
jgi:hypothetical protein